MKQKPVIETSLLSIGYISGRGKVHVLNDSLNLKLYPGELTGLLGLNGVGKSTLIRTLCGFQPMLKGRIKLMDKDLKAYSPSQLSRLTGIVLTETTNVGGFTVFELVSLGRHPYTNFMGQCTANDIKIIEDSLEAVGISHKASNYVSELSDGERQKAMIAKVLAQQCPVILLDEPMAFLDVTGRIEIMSLLRRLAIEQQKAVLMSTHDLDLAIQTSDCLWLQAKRRPMLCGTPEDLILNGTFESFFGKNKFVFDRSNGKLFTVVPLSPIGVEGDPITAYWVGNALIRNGYRPSTNIISKQADTSTVPISPGYINIYCVSGDHILIVQSDGKETIAKSVAEMIAVIKHKVGTNVE